MNVKSFIALSELKGAGNGLFANRSFMAGELVMENDVSDHRYDDEQAMSLMKAHDLRRVSDEYLSFIWNNGVERRVFCQGHIQYANHSDDPNTRIERDYDNNLLKMYAIRDIKVNEEITHYYADKEMYIKKNLFK